MQSIESPGRAPAGITIRQCGPEDQEAWDAYLAETPGASFYHRFGWTEINYRNFGHRSYYLAAVDAQGAFQGVFPLVYVQSRLFGRILCSLPFVNYGGPICMAPEVTQALLSMARELVRDLNADYAEFRTLAPIDDSLPTSLHKVSMSIRLAEDADSVWQSYSSKHRTNIRRVYKNDISVRHAGAELLDTFYDLLIKSWRRLGTPVYRKAYFASILDSFPEQTRIFVAYAGDTPIATAFNGYFGGTVEGMWAAASPEHQKLQPNYVLYWEMIKHACESGNQLYHLGRSTVDSNAEQFKKKWNAEPHQLYWQYILNKRTEMPQLNVANPKYQLAIQAWRKLPLAATTLIGPLLAKSIP